MIISYYAFYFLSTQFLDSNENEHHNVCIMDFIFPVIFAIIIVGLVALLFLLFTNNNMRGPKVEKKKDRQTIIREANRKLAQDSHNPQGLKALADLFFSEHTWDKAYTLYNLMLDISTAHSEIDVLTSGLRQGICAIKMNRHGDAFKGLTLARRIDPNNAEVNYYMGLAFYMNNDYEKAITLLKKTIVVTPENPEPYRFLGLALSKNKRFKESLAYLKKTLDNSPEDKEIMFAIAESFAETNSSEHAIKIFSHLRADPEFGAKACLQAGILHVNSNQIDKAIQDFEIGLKHPNAPVEIAVDIRYRLAQALLKMQKISDALVILKEVQTMIPNYKDVPTLISRYQELNQNKNLQIYLMAVNSEFIALCKQIVSHYYPDAKSRITSISSSQDCTDIITEIETMKWEDLVIFRFYRSPGVTGELSIREVHTKIRDTKAGRAVCLTAGSYSDEARKFIDGRPIDLIEKSVLTKLLSSIPSVPTSHGASQRTHRK